MKDNDPKHTSRLAQEFFQTMGINWWKTPPESPAANPIENLWHELKVRLNYYISLLIVIVFFIIQEYIRREVKPRKKEDLVKGILQF